MIWRTLTTANPSVAADDNPVNPLPDAAITVICLLVRNSLTCLKRNKFAGIVACR
jgi:hypothetical protein